MDEVSFLTSLDPMESKNDIEDLPLLNTRPSNAESVAKLGLCLALGLWVASLLTLFGFALLESLTSLKIGIYGWVLAWICVSLIQAIFLASLVMIVKSIAKP